MSCSRNTLSILGSAFPNFPFPVFLPFDFPDYFFPNACLIPSLCFHYQVPSKNEVPVLERLLLLALFSAFPLFRSLSPKSAIESFFPLEAYARVSKNRAAFACVLVTLTTFKKVVNRQATRSRWQKSQGSAATTS